jgi:hypothetical protein
MRHAIILAIGFTLGVACSLADELEGAACHTESDCDRTQACVRTAHQFTQAAVGTCSKSGECIPGEQVGCQCKDRGCPGMDLLPVDHPEFVDNNNAHMCFCCPSDVCDLEQQQVAVIVDVDANFTAQCQCCDPCPDGCKYKLDDDQNVDDNCDCVPDPEAESETDTDGPNCST